MKTEATKSIPLYFKPILWSYDFDRLNPQKNERDIIINTINYGDLIHWMWVRNNYGQETVCRVLERSHITELRPGARRLAEVIFSS